MSSSFCVALAIQRVEKCELKSAFFIHSLIYALILEAAIFLRNRTCFIRIPEKL